MVISSISSVPEKIPGIVLNGEYYDFKEKALPRYVRSDRVFGVGNVVTGPGNIRASAVHSKEVTTKLIENNIVVAEETSTPARFYAGAEAQGVAQAQTVRARVQRMPGLSDLEIAGIEQRIPVLQQRVGYAGDYDSWIAGVIPPVAAGQVNIPTHLAEESTHQGFAGSAALDCVACHCRVP
jgi:hypothetical protein